MTELTDQQEKVLRFVARHISEQGAPPTFRGIAKHFGFASTRAAQDHVAALVRKGYLEHRPGEARGLRLANALNASPPVAVPIIGQVAAGSPRDASQLPMGTLPFPRELMGRGRDLDDLFALRVHGDSMMDAGILEGDMVIAKTQKTVAHGDIVVALLDGESTVKRFHKKDGKILLLPENKRMKPIAVEGRELVVQGRVVGVQRFYR
jgi:repressor LexA